MFGFNSDVKRTGEQEPVLKYFTLQYHDFLEYNLMRVLEEASRVLSEYTEKKVKGVPW